METLFYRQVLIATNSTAGTWDQASWLPVIADIRTEPTSGKTLDQVAKGEGGSSLKNVKSEAQFTFSFPQERLEFGDMGTRGGDDYHIFS